MIFKTDKHEYCVVPRESPYRNAHLDIWYKKEIPQGFFARLFRMKPKSSWVSTGYDYSLCSLKDKEEQLKEFSSLTHDEQFKLLQDSFDAFEDFEDLTEKTTDYFNKLFDV
jgi:hypothetical protein